MTAFRKLITCVTMAAFLVAVSPCPSNAQFLAFAPQEIVTGIKTFLTNIQNSKVVLFATQSAEKIKGAIGEFNSAMASFMANGLLQRMQDIQRAKCKFDQKKKKLMCSSAVQTYKKVSAKVGEGKELINRGKALVEESKELIAEGERLVEDAKNAAKQADLSLTIIKDAARIISETKRLTAELKLAKRDYEDLAKDATSAENAAAFLEVQATKIKGEALIEFGNGRYPQIQAFIDNGGDLAEAEAQRREADNSIRQGQALLRQAAEAEGVLSDRRDELEDRMNQIGHELCQVFNEVFAGSAEQIASAAAEGRTPNQDGGACELEDVDIGATINEKLASIQEDFDRLMDQAEEFKHRADMLFEDAKQKVKEGQQLLDDAKDFAGSMKDCKPGQDPKKDNCYKSADAEYCKKDSVKDASDYCDKKYPKKEMPGA